VDDLTADEFHPLIRVGEKVGKRGELQGFHGFTSFSDDSRKSEGNMYGN
jgi:hypothetical protein